MIKKLMKKLVSKKGNYYAEEIINKIKDYDVVSFDIFDTLIKRTVADSTEVYFHTAEAVNKKLHTSFDPAKFRINRINAAVRASELNRDNNDGKEEVDIFTIYKCIQNEYKDYTDALIAQELDIELTCAFSNPVMKKVFDWCIKNDKKIIIASDMYLPRNIIEKILYKVGYSGYQKLYVSSELFKKKSTGSMYELIKADNKGRIIHIGDSYKADFLMAKKHGIGAYIIAKHPYRLKHSRVKTKMSVLEKKNFCRIKTVMSDFVDSNWSDFFQYGYEVIGPLLYGFSIWIRENEEHDKYQNLFFMSRDGYLLQKAFDILYKDSNSKYLYVSRRSLGTSVLCEPDGLNRLFKTNDLEKKWNCRMLSYRFGLDYELTAAIWNKSGFADDESIRGREALKDERIGIFFDAIKESVVRRATEERELLAGYLGQIGFDGKLAVVDTGGNCTSQKSINELPCIKESTKICGLYLWKKNTGSLLARSFPITEEELAFGNMSIIEFFLTSHEGSTINYKKNSTGEVVPNVKKYEHDEHTDEIIQEVQNGALHFVELFSNAFYKDCFTENITKNNVIAVSKYPKYGETCMLGDLNVFNDDNYVKMAAPNKRAYYIFHPRQLVRDISGSCWKIGFIKRLVPLPLNYYGLLNIANLIKKKITK